MDQVRTFGDVLELNEFLRNEDVEYVDLKITPWDGMILFVLIYLQN